MAEAQNDPALELQTRLEDLGGRLFEETLKELFRRLTGGACKDCGRTAASDKDIASILRFLDDHGFSVGRAGRGRLTPITGDLPFADPEIENRFNPKKNHG